MIAYLKKFYSILSRSQTRSSFFLLILLILGMVLETIGIGSILPVLTVVSQPSGGDNFYIEWIKQTFSMESDKSLTLLMLSGLVIIYFIKSLFLLFLVFYQAKFIYGIQKSLSYQFFEGYLCEDYSFHLSRNSSDLIRNTMSEVTQFTSAVNNTMSIFSEVLVLIGITFLLVLVEPYATILVISTMTALGIFYLILTKGKSEKWGNERMHHDGKRIQHLQQGLSGIKEVKISGREKNFLEIYKFHNTGSASSNRKQSMIVALPRIFIELAAICGIVLFIFLYLTSQNNLNTVIPLLGLFALAAFRIMPSINRIVSAMQSVRFTLPILHTIHSEIMQLRNHSFKIEKSSIPLKLSSSIELKRVNFNYENSPTVLKDIDLVIPNGSCIGIIGESGAGKSTLLDLLLGLNLPSSGQILIDGKEIGECLREWQKGIGYVPQEVFLTDDSLKRNIAFGLKDEDIDIKKIEKAIHLAKLDDFVSALEEGLDTKVGERGVRISGGQKQRIGIARALYENPSVLVLDEATSSLDVITEREVMNSIRELIGSKTIIIVAHRMSTMADTDFLFKIENGTLGEKIFYKDTQD